MVSALTGGETGLVRDVVVGWRLPRVAAAVVFGAALGVSGAMFQSLTRNPWHTGVIGFSAGLLHWRADRDPDRQRHLPAGGGRRAAGRDRDRDAVYVVAWQRGVLGFRLIVVGIGVSAMLASLNTWLILRAELNWRYPLPHGVPGPSTACPGVRS